MTSGCPTCGGTDHKRASSSRCPLRKKRARESALDDGSVVWETYAVKRGLRGFVCPLLDGRKKETLLSEIRRDVRDLSSFSVDLSVLAHYFYTSRMVKMDDDTEFLRLYPKFDGAALAAVLSGADARKLKRARRCADPDGLFARWSALCGRTYDVKLRSFLVNHIVNRYATSLETNVCTHAFSRIKRAVAAKTGLDKKTVHESCYARYYAGETESGCPPVDAWFDSGLPAPPTAKAVQRDYWRFVPMFRRVQVEAWESAVDASKSGRGRGFRLFPQYSHGLKHLLYDSSALFELLRRVDRDTTPTTWPKFNGPVNGEAGSRLHWRRHFDCPRNFGYSVQTDGVAVSLTMMKIGVVKKNKTESKRLKTGNGRAPPPPTTTTSPIALLPENCIAVDPGAREPVVTCTVDDAGRFRFSRLTAGRVYYETGELWREKRRKKITSSVDDRVCEDRKRSADTKDYSSKHGGDPSTYTAFRQRRFAELQRVYENRKLARLRFEKYSRRQKFMSSVVTRYFPDGQKTVLYGAGCKFMNRVSFRGHRKFSHDSLLRELKRSGRTVLLVDEAYTTKRCHRCSGGSAVVVGPSPHRYVYCPVCRRGTNRDRNGAANILLKATGRWDARPRNTIQPPLPTSRGGGNDSSPP